MIKSQPTPKKDWKHDTTNKILFFPQFLKNGMVGLEEQLPVVKKYGLIVKKLKAAVMVQ